VLASMVDHVDLDGHLLLGRARDHPLPYESLKVGLPSRALWG